MASRSCHVRASGASLIKMNKINICTLAMCLIIVKSEQLCSIKATEEKVGVEMHKHFSITQHNSIICRVVQNKIISAIFNRNIIIAIRPKILAQLSSLFREIVGTMFW